MHDLDQDPRRWSSIELDGIAAADSPAVIAAFEGWNDAGRGRERGVIATWPPRGDASPSARSTPRTTTTSRSPGRAGGRRRPDADRLVWPTTRLSLARPGRASAATWCCVHGIEPNMRWQGFCRRAGRRLRRARRANWWSCSGALLADSPHTRPVPVTGAASDAELAARLHGRSRSTTRARPGSSACCRTPAGGRDPAVSLWAAVPHYVAQPPSPKATLALLRGVEDVLDVTDAAGRPARRGAGLGARRGRAGRAGHRGGRVRADARGGQGRDATCPRPAARRSPGSSSATCAAAATAGSTAAADTARPGRRGTKRRPLTPPRDGTTL